jgi:16S rRNA (adenine1518-N6/adenine1519-N6)-dimethyltransferase
MQHIPYKKFGQNFLTQPAIAQKIVNSLHIKNSEIVLEIGPGPGALCESIIKENPEKYYAIEIDNRLVHHLNEQFRGLIEVIEEDFLQWDISTIFPKKRKIKIIGNIPYNITSPILFKLVDNFKNLDCAVFMIQKEVARRIVSTPNSKEYGILSVLLQTFASIEYLFDVSRKNFKPVPKVDSAVIKLTFYDQVTDVENMHLFRQLVRGTFNYRRKMLRNSLSRIFDQTIVSSIDFIDLSRRPEQLSIAEFKHLSNIINQLIEK